MNINIKATNMELTEAINAYVNKRVMSLGKFSKDGEMIVFVEVGKINNHHKKGEVFRSEFNIELSGRKFFAEAETEDLYKAIDETKEEIARQLINTKDKDKTLFKRGSNSIKKMLKGLTKRNPFTSKY